MGQAASRAQGSRQEVQECFRLYTLCWHGCPPQKCMEAVLPAVPLYDSDDETTDSAVVSALAMTDPAELRCSYRPAAMHRTNSGPAHRTAVQAPILQSLTHPDHSSKAAAAAAAAGGSSSSVTAGAPARQPSGVLSAAAAGQQQPRGKHSSSSSHHRKPRSRDVTVTAAAAAAVAAASTSTTPAAAAAASRQPGISRNRSSSTPKLTLQQQQQQQLKHKGKLIVPLTAAALDAVGQPCRIGADLPPASLRSQRGSAADVVGVRPYHHIHLMQLHKQQQQQQQRQSVQGGLCVEVKAQAVWGWQVAGSAPQVAT